MATNQLQKNEPTGALVKEERPDFIESSAAGAEGITSDDLRLPRLMIAQGLSKAIIESDPAYIEGLKLGHMYNDLSQTIYGKGPLSFIAVKRDVRRIEFDPNDRSVPIDLDVPALDPRNDWSKDASGRSVAPLATKFSEFVILLIDGVEEGETMPEPIVLSIAETNKWNRKAAERLNGFIKMRMPPAPIYAGVYTVEVGMEKNDKGTFGTYVIKQKQKFVQNEGLYLFAKQFHEEIAHRTIDIQRDAELQHDTTVAAASDM